MKRIYYLKQSRQNICAYLLNELDSPIRLVFVSSTCFMPWVNQEYKYSCIQTLAMNILKQGIIPSHVAFIMDGNRRYAVSQGLLKTEGHNQGFSKLSEVCDISKLLLRFCDGATILE